MGYELGPDRDKRFEPGHFGYDVRFSPGWYDRSASEMAGIEENSDGRLSADREKVEIANMLGRMTEIGTPVPMQLPRGES